MSQIRKLATGLVTKTACLVKYFAGHLLRPWQVYTPAKVRPCTMEYPWFYSVLNEFRSEYRLQKESPVTMTNHRKIQKAVRDRLSTVELLPKDDCQAVWDQIFHKDLQKDHRDLNWLKAHRTLPSPRDNAKVTASILTNFHGARSNMQ
ncbi:hypothetical protein Y1Q_0021732 [Alligator mississippiensis]|uniref:Uncharacterized protein n=1 Tax=Alligator mississippiensis TaxID=8496 RepID=A0A151PB44_ALLMI|nr:hypothetical protein Y1Q_0021732 [Alligator mississippiensis]